MQIQVDTREHRQEWQRIQKQFDKLGIRYFRSKLYVGDYMNFDNPHLVIDRKKDLLELCGNVTQQHERFRSELQRALEHEIQIIILCEHGSDITCLEDVYFWINPRSEKYEIRMVDGKPAKVKLYPKATQGEQLYKSLLTIQQRYHVKFEFCSKHETGKRIVELLGGDSDV